MLISKPSILAAFLVFTTSQFVLAEEEQNPGRIKANGEAMQGHLHSTYQRLGQERSQILYYNVVGPRNVQPQGTVAVPADVVPQEPTPIAETRDLVIAIRKDLKASDTALAKIKAAHPNEPEVLKLITSVENHHSKAHDACNMAEDACNKDDGDQAVIGQCCSDMWHELEAAQVDTQKLMKMLKLERLAPPKKLEVVKASTK